MCRLKKSEMQNFTIILFQKNLLALLKKNTEDSMKLYLPANHKTQMVRTLRYYLYISTLSNLTVSQALSLTL